MSDEKPADRSKCDPLCGMSVSVTKGRLNGYVLPEDVPRNGELVRPGHYYPIWCSKVCRDERRSGRGKP